MKKITLFAFMASGFALFAQSPITRVDHVRAVDASEQRRIGKDLVIAPATYGVETVVWSENFSAGIPSTWTNAGTANGAADADAIWSYRGPSTTPGVAVGSRGGYAGPVGTGQLPILSSTAANGFVIFDSDFLDNAGIAGNFGNGLAAAPHAANLTTSTINLTGYSEVDLIFNQYYRRFSGPTGQGVPATYIDFSINGGTTFPYTVMLNAGIAVNSATPRTDVAVVPIPAAVAGQASVQVRFRFDGDYYFWMVDDLKIIETPKHRMEFIALPSGAPKLDIIYGPAAGSSKMGNVSLKQIRPITFDCNVINNGSSNQTNVKLQMKIMNSTGTVVQTINGPVKSVLTSGDTLDFNDLNTTASAWVPTSEGVYGISYRVLSDSITLVYNDTMTVNVSSDKNALDFSRWDNSIGTTSIGTDGSAFAARHDFLNAERLFGVNVGISRTGSRSGAIVEMAVYDTSAFDGFTTGFDQNAILAYSQKTLVPADSIAMNVYFDLTSTTTGFPLSLPTGSYFFVFTMYSNNGAKPVAMKNDQSFENAAGSAMMYLTTVNGTAYNRWFTGYSSSRSFENPWIRSATCPSATAAACMGISVDEEAMETITVAPVPATDFLNVSFGSAEGVFEATLVDLTGKVVLAKTLNASAGTYSALYVGDLSAGMYTLTLKDGQAVKTLKVSVQ